MLKLHFLCVLMFLSGTGQAQERQPAFSGEIFMHMVPDNLKHLVPPKLPCECPATLFYNSSRLHLYEKETKFVLYTRGGNGINAKDISALRSSRFNPKLPFKVITHGWFEKPGSSWMTDMKDALLSGSQPDMNVVIVDWSKHSNHKNYKNVAKDSIYIGRVLAQFLHFIKRNFPDFSAKQVHLIGFSMGAHVSGIAGQYYPGIRRISGLDPAGAVYQCAPESERLTRDDADFVDVVHTTERCWPLGFFGTYNRSGHQDFYVNGGDIQPGCSSLWDDLLAHKRKFSTYTNLRLCHHHRAVDYFLESIKTPRIQFGYQCPNFTIFKKGTCFDSNRRAIFGYHAKPGAEGRFYLETQAISPLLQRYLNIKAAAGRGFQGTLDLNVIGPKNTTNQKIPLRNDLRQGSFQLYSAMVGIPLVADVSELTYTLSYQSNGLRLRGSPSIINYLDVVATDVTSNEKYCVTPLRSLQNSTSYSVDLRMGPCSSRNNFGRNAASRGMLPLQQF